MSIERPPAVALMKLRQITRGMMSYNVASTLSETFVRHIPRPLQRLSERFADFPVSTIIRGSNLLLIRVPKCASVSLSKQVYGRVSHVPHRTALFYFNSDPEFFNRSSSFAVLRDPIERAESAFRWLKGNRFEIMRPNPETRRSLEAIGSFEEFVLNHIYPAFRRGRLNRLDPVLHLQRDYVCDVNGDVLVKRLFKMERMQEVQSFLRENGVASPEVSENRSGRNLPIVYQPGVREALLEIYRDDLQIVDRI